MTFAHSNAVNVAVDLPEWGLMFWFSVTNSDPLIKLRGDRIILTLNIISTCFKLLRFFPYYKR